MAGRFSQMLVVLVIALSTTAATAAGDRAGKNVSAAKNEARPLAEKGYLRFKAGKFDEAMALFRKAEKHYHAPGHVLYIARCQRELGKLVESRDSYISIVSEQLERYAPAPFVEAQATARDELAALRKRIPQLRIVITPERQDVTLSIDGRARELSKPIHELNPGQHVIRVSAGDDSVERRVRLVEGQQERVQLHLALPPPPSRPRPLLLPAIVSFGVAGGGLVVGVATGVVSLQQVSAIDEQCVDKHCPPELEADAEQATTLGTVSTIGLVVAAAGAAAGGTMLVIDQLGTAHSTAELQLLPGGGQLRWRF